MTSAATATLSLQWTPPNATVNSGNVLYPVVANYNAQSVGQFDVLYTESAPIANPVPFGSISQCLMLVIKNGQATDIGVKINGGLQLCGTTASITTFALGASTVTGLNGMTTSMVGQTITFSGCNTPGNNGTFVIASVVNATTVTVTNASGVAPDTNNGHIVWISNTVLDNFKVPAGGVFMYATPQAPGTPTNTIPESFISSCTVTSYGVPAVGNVETISWFVYGN